MPSSSSEHDHHPTKARALDVHLRIHNPVKMSDSIPSRSQRLNKRRRAVLEEIDNAKFS